MNPLRLSPNRSRLFYDFIVLFFSAVIAIGLWKLLKGEWVLELLSLPFVGLCAQALSGVYSRHRLASVPRKCLAISLAVLLVSIFVYLTVRDWTLVVLWGSIAWAPLVLPRIFLSFNRSKPITKIGRTLCDSIKERGPVLVVGGAGYIGSHVVHRLLSEGHAVRILDRLFYGNDAVRGFMSHPHFELIEGDVTEISKLVRSVDGVSSIVHLAGLVGDPACAVDQRTTAHCNIIATRMLKEVAQSFGVHRFVFASSCSVYGASDEIVDERSTLNPVSLYARTKIESENELLADLRDDFFVSILRFATVFGHSQRPRFDLVGNLFAAQAFKEGIITVHGGDQWRPFVHVSDLARAILMVLKASPEKIQGQVFNVGDERLNVTVNELAQKVKEVVSSDRPVEIVLAEGATDKRNYRVSFRKIQQQLGFNSVVSIEDGIREILHHFISGTYSDYRNPRYSNLEVTKQVVNDFQDPLQNSRLYAPYHLAQAA